MRLRKKKNNQELQSTRVVFTKDQLISTLNNAFRTVLELLLSEGYISQDQCSRIEHSYSLIVLEKGVHGYIVDELTNIEEGKLAIQGIKWINLKSLGSDNKPRSN